MGLAEDVTIRRNDHFISKVNVSEKNGTLRFAMGYTDKPLNEESLAMIALDVSLFVESPSGKKYWGNGEEERAMLLEKIIIPEKDVEVGEYTIHLVCNGIMGDIFVNASVVVVGSLCEDKTLKFAKEDKCVESCNGHGECENGMCKCSEGFYGSSCQFETQIIDPQYDKDAKFISNATEMEFNPLQIQMLEIPITKNITSVNLEIKGDQGTSRPDLVLFSKQRPTFLWDTSYVEKFSNQRRLKIYPNDIINAKMGDSIFVTLYNLNQRKRIVTANIVVGYEQEGHNPNVDEPFIPTSRPEEPEIPEEQKDDEKEKESGIKDESTEGNIEKESSNNQNSSKGISKGATIAVSASLLMLIIAVVAVTLLSRSKKRRVSNEFSA